MDESMKKAAIAVLEEKTADVQRISAAFKVDEKGRFSMSTEQHNDYKAAVKGAREAKEFIDSVNEMKSIQDYLDAPASVPDAALGLTGIDKGTEAKSMADVFMFSDQFKAAQDRGFKDLPSRITGEYEGKSIHSLSGGSVTHQALGNVENVGIAERQFRKTRIRDLFPKSSTKSAALYGVRETGWVNNAEQVRQRYAADGVSPQTGADSDVYGKAKKSKITLTPVLYPVAQIVHTLDAHTSILDDAPRLRTFLNTRMAEGVKYDEDFELLHSLGGAEEITGLFNVTGVQGYTGVNTDKHSVQIRRAITKAQLAEYDPTGIVLSPEMWEMIEVEEDDQGGFRVATSVAIGAVKQVWHLDVASTTAMSDEQYMIGSFGLGAQLHDREAVSVTMSTENSDNFERGVVTFKGAERLALEVPRPESFVIGTWTVPA